LALKKASRSPDLISGDRAGLAGIGTLRATVPTRTSPTKSAGSSSHAMDRSSVKNKNAAEMGKRDDNNDTMGQEIIARWRRVCHLFTFRLAHCRSKPFS